MITQLETKFKQYYTSQEDYSVFPILQSPPIKHRQSEKKQFGEVFTPVHLIDKMILTSKPLPTQLNCDLCAGRGNFTIRILRYFTNNFPTFDLQSYLKNNHFFNEYNSENARDIITIFGTEINLFIGPAQELKSLPDNTKGFWQYNEESKQWQPTSAITILNREKPKTLFDSFFEI